MINHQLLKQVTQNQVLISIQAMVTQKQKHKQTFFQPLRACLGSPETRYNQCKVHRTAGYSTRITYEIPPRRNVILKNCNYLSIPHNSFQNVQIIYVTETYDPQMGMRIRSKVRNSFKREIPLKKSEKSMRMCRVPEKGCGAAQLGAISLLFESKFSFQEFYVIELQNSLYVKFTRYLQRLPLYFVQKSNSCSI